MSSNKLHKIECELTLNYDLVINAKDEDEAREKAYERLKLIVDTQKMQPAFYNAGVSSVRSVETGVLT